ncbi:hypothetical protein ACCO45_012680 [Purpureocillium lilacinum]|uniref:Uncharacterized protein n=1 Tax=Purpureocillium lilacinum TaxID=33203 RepID=A0ACC4D9B9_PURLI
MCIETTRPMFWVRIPTVSPKCSALSGVGLDPELPEDPRQFHELDGLCGCLALAQYVPGGRVVLAGGLVPGAEVVDTCGIAAGCAIPFGVLLGMGNWRPRRPALLE